MRTIITLIFTFSLVACGSQDESSENTKSEEPAFATKSDVAVLKGERGDKGERGEKGDKGDKGDAGKDGTPTTQNQWFDPITERTWLIGVLKTNDDLCGGSYRLPTTQEALEAQEHGIFLASSEIGGPDDMWTSDADTNNTNAFNYVRDDGYSASDYATAQHGALCIRSN